MNSYEIPYPRLLTSSLGLARVIQPINVSITLSMTPLSYASMELPAGESLPARGLVELFTPLGSAGIFRVRSPQNTYGERSTTAELEHAIVEVGDYLVTTDIDDMMPAATAMQTVFGHYRGSLWQLGSVSAMGTGEIAVQAKHTRVLETMIALVEQCEDCMFSFDFTTTPWTVSIIKQDSTVSAEGRLSRNINTCRIIYDDTELCTRAYYEISTKDASGHPTSFWKALDADTIANYGIVEREVSIESKYTEAEADAVAEEYIRHHKNPRISIQISAEELSNTTGEPFDLFRIGKLFRLALPDYNTQIEQPITELSWDNVYGDPAKVDVSLAYEEDTAIKFLHDVDSKGRSGGGGGGKKKTEDTFKEYRTRIEQDDYHIALIAEHVNEAEDILEQAGLQLDSHGVLIYADDNVNMLGSKMGVMSDHIFQIVGVNSGDWSDWDGVSLKSITGSTLWQTKDNITGLVGEFDVVTDAQTGKKTVVIKSGGGLSIRRNGTEFGVYDNGTLTAGVVVDKINGQAGYTQILGSKIKIGNSDAETVINGKASIADLTATNAHITNLQTGQASFTALHATGPITSAGQGTFATLSVGGAIWASKSMTGIGSGTVTTFLGTADADLSHYHTVSFNDGKITIGGTTKTAPDPFDIAATTWYQNKIAAAKNSVVVTMSDSGWIINDASTGNYTRVLTPQKDGVDVTSQSVTVSGQTIWQLGYNAGNSAGYAAGWGAGYAAGWGAAANGSGRSGNTVSFPSSTQGVFDEATATAHLGGSMSQKKYNGATLYIQVATNVYQAYNGSKLYYAASDSHSASITWT